MPKPDISEVTQAKRNATELSEAQFRDILTLNDPEAFHKRLIESIRGGLDSQNPDKSLVSSRLYTINDGGRERYLYASKKRNEYLELASKKDYRTIRRHMHHISMEASEAAFNALMGG